MQVEGVFKASVKEAPVHCKICDTVGHNARTCPHRFVTEGANRARQNKKRNAGSSSQPTPCTTFEASPSEELPQTQPSGRGTKSRRT
ncbi:hypothetical protein LIER_28923 [Lithospermum erythrorhizon]|uniref:CCHC-type domain-containing protein n=1 Tax=Lithospermum erythrorhizon TaxID=34254 RepID=A0AAV3RHU3_LITER